MSKKREKGPQKFQFIEFSVNKKLILYHIGM
jgi:hypothetical protein